VKPARRKNVAQEKSSSEGRRKEAQRIALRLLKFGI